MSALREILATFDIIVNSEQLDAGTKKLDTFVEKLKGVGAALAGFGIVKSIVSFGEHVTEAARAVEFHAGRMEMDTNEYQRLSQVAANYGMTMEQLQIANTLFTRALSGMDGTMGTFSDRTGQAREAMRALHLDAKQFKGQHLEQILPVISDAMIKITDPMERVAIGLRLFGHRGRAIMPMMAVGGDELRRQFAAAVPVFEEATIKSADRSAIAVKQLGRAWDNLINNSFGRALMDTMTVVAHKLTDVVQVLKELTKNSEIGKGILVALGTALAVAAAIALAAWWPVLVPILAVVAAFAALALAVDDFIVFMKGGDSLIADFFDELLGEGGADKAREAIKGMWEDFKNFAAELKDEAFKKFLSDTKDTIAGIRDAFHQIKAAIQWIEEHWAKMTAGFDKFAQFFGGGSHDIKPTATVVDALTAPGSPFVNNVAPPPEIGPPTVAQVATYGQPGVPAAGGMVFYGGIDSGELARKVKQTVDEHNASKIDGILRDALAGAGGSK